MVVEVVWVLMLTVLTNLLRNDHDQLIVVVEVVWVLKLAEETFWYLMS